MRRLRTPLLPANAPESTPLLVVQTGILREKVMIIGSAGPVQLRDVILWDNEEAALEWGIVYDRRTLSDLDREEREEIYGRFTRRVEAADFATIATLREAESAALDHCRERVEFRKLPMKMLGADWRFDRSKITFHFAAEHRVDFRLLVRDLASMYRCRIELHQVGVRDETAIYGGMGTCGRELCCHQHLDHFPVVSVRMAKLQNLPLNPAKTSGVCGRLKCCLRYEYDVYEELAAALPALGSRKDIDGLPGEITQHLPLSGLIVVRFDDGRRDTLAPAEWEQGARDTTAKRPKLYAGDSAAY